MTAPPLLSIVGPTASGKTELSVRVAEALGAEIVCVDSTLVYRGMDVGTAKPSPEDRRRVPHHLVDLAEPGEPFSVARFQRLAREAIAGIRSRGRPALVVSGGGLYYRAVVDHLEFPGTAPGTRGLLEAEAAAVRPETLHARLEWVDPQAARRIQPANVRRTVRALEVVALTGRRFSSFYRSWDRYPEGAVRAAGIEVPREVLDRRIARRAAAQMPGLLRETEDLLRRGHGPFIASARPIGYAEAAACLEGRLSRERALALTVRRTRALARRQMAWLRRDPRIRWFGAGDRGAADALEDVVAYLAEGGPLAGASTAAAGRGREGRRR